MSIDYDDHIHTGPSAKFITWLLLTATLSGAILIVLGAFPNLSQGFLAKAVPLPEEMIAELKIHEQLHTPAERRTNTIYNPSSDLRIRGEIEKIFPIRSPKNTTALYHYVLIKEGSVHSAEGSKKLTQFWVKIDDKILNKRIIQPGFDVEIIHTSDIKTSMADHNTEFYFAPKALAILKRYSKK